MPQLQKDCWAPGGVTNLYLVCKTKLKFLMLSCRVLTTTLAAFIAPVLRSRPVFGIDVIYI